MTLSRVRSAIFARADLRLVTRCLAAVLLYCGLASASTPGGRTIHFSVTDDASQPVPEAIVEVSLGARVIQTLATDAQGKASVYIPSPGQYSLKVHKIGYIDTQTALQVVADTSPEEVDVVLHAAALSKQNVEVQAEAPNPVTRQSSSQSKLSPVQAKIVPGKPATLTDTLPLIPGIVRAKDGSVQIAGYGEDHSALLINSVDVTDPATGAFGLTVPIDSVQTISVSEMPYLAQYGRFTAGVVTAETRRGGDKWHADLNDPLPEFRIRSGHLEGLRDATPRFNLSGPLIKDHLYFLEGAEYSIDKREVYTLPYPLNQTISESINSFSQVDAILSPTQTLTASFHWAPHTLQYAGLDYFNPRSVTPNAGFHESTAALIHRWGIGDGLLQSTFAVTRVSSGIYAQGNGDMVLTPTANSGNYFSQEARRAIRYEWIEKWSPRTFHFAGAHAFQFGSTFAHSENDGRFNARPVLIEDAAGHLVRRIDFTGGGAFDLSDFEPAVYAQDHWSMGSRFALDLGARFEAQTITHTTRTAPRAGFVWTPMADQKLVVRGGIGVFYDAVPLDVYAFSSYPQQTVTTYDGLGNIIGSPLTYFNITSQTANQHFPFIHRKLTSGNFAPYSVAWNVEMERPLGKLLLVRLRYLQSHAYDMLTIQPQVINNQNALVLGSSGAARTRQFEFTARIGSDPARQFFFSYVRQHARGDINDASTYLGDFPFPVVRNDIIASLPSEIPNRFLLWGIYKLPHKIRLIPHIELRDGFPYQPSNVFQQLLTPALGPQYRFPRYFSFDLRTSKDFQITKKHAIRLSVTVLNLTNHFNALEVHSNIADPQYGTFFGNYHRHVLFDFDYLF